MFLSILEFFGKKHPDLIISCKFYSLYSWKVYMKNKNNIFSCLPIGSSQGSEARKQSKQTKRLLDFWMYPKRRPYLVEHSCSVNKHLNSQFRVIWIEHLESPDQYSDHCGQMKKKLHGIFALCLFSRHMGLWNEIPDTSSQNGTSDFYFLFLMCTF